MKKYFVTGIGNAITDILAFVEDSFLENSHFKKGSMSLIDKKNVSKLVNLKYDKISSGGSTANAIVAMSNFGIKSAFIGKVGSGNAGQSFTQDMHKANVDFNCKNLADHGATARSFVLITKDGQRTMATFLGSASDIESEIDQELIENSDILYIEGYLWDNKKTITALKEAIAIAKNAGVKIAFTLSDGFCVDRHRNDFLELIKSLDILFANEDEIKSLLLIKELDKNKIQDLTKDNSDLIIIVTRSEKGAMIFDKSNIYDIPTKALKPVDSTGAGDAFAAGLFYGLNHKYDLKKCGEIGNIFAGTIIQKLGARFDDKEIASIKNSLSK